MFCKGCLLPHAEKSLPCKKCLSSGNWTDLWPIIVTCASALVRKGRFLGETFLKHHTLFLVNYQALVILPSGVSCFRHVSCRSWLLYSPYLHPTNPKNIKLWRNWNKREDKLVKDDNNVIKHPPSPWMNEKN